MVRLDLKPSRYLGLVAEQQLLDVGHERIAFMKTKVIVALLLCMLTASQPAFTLMTPDNDEPPQLLGASVDNPHMPDLLAITPAIPRGPRDLLRDYESEMASIAARLSMDLAAISSAVGTQQITREQGEYVSHERYQVARMQFQLFSALHTVLEEDLTQTSAVQTDPTLSSGGATVLVAMPFSSLQLSPSLVEYLRLTPTQVRSIQRLMDQERVATEPLMVELRATSGEIGAANQQRQNNHNEGGAQRLAAKQARLLNQLMSANSHLQRRINDVLDPQQRKKLDSFKRTSAVTVREGN
jgi:hypothetical protein